MEGLRQLADDEKFEAWLKTCAAMTPELKRKRMSQLESQERGRQVRERQERYEEREERTRDEEEPEVPDGGVVLPSWRRFGRK